MNIIYCKNTSLLCEVVNVCGAGTRCMLRVYILWTTDDLFSPYLSIQSTNINDVIVTRQC